MDQLQAVAVNCPQGEKSNFKSKIVIVEDEAIIAADLAGALKTLGYLVCGLYGTAEEALDFLEKECPDVVMIDIDLKGKMDGLEAAEIIREKWAIAVVFLIDYADTDRLMRAKPAYPFGYLVKPFQERYLKITVEMALRVAESEKDRRQKEKELQINEAKYRQLFHKAPTGLYEVDFTTNRFTSVNPTMCEYLGYTETEMLALKPIDILTEESQDLFISRVEKILAGESVPTDPEFRIRGKFGRTLWVQLNVNFLKRDGQIYGASVVAHNISGRKRAEDSLRESELAHRTLLEGLPDIVMRFDREARHLFVSRNIEEVTDIPAAQYIGQTHRELGFPENMCQFWEQAIFKVFKVAAPDETEFLYEGKKGPTIFNWRLVPELDSRGKLASVLSIIRDVTAQRRAEENYQTLFKEMLDGFALHEIIYDAGGKPVDYRLLRVNPAFERLTGLKAADIMGRTALEVLPGLEPHWIETYGRVVLTGEPAFFEYYSRDLGKHFEVKAFRTAPNQFVSIFTDVTERKRAEEKLTESEERFRRTYYTSPDAVNLNRLDDGLYVDVNDGFTRLTGYTREEVVGRTSIDINIWHDPADRQKLVHGLREKGYYENLEARFRRKDGTVTTALMSATLISLKGVLHIISVTRDISDMKKMEAEKEALQVQLQQARKMEAIGTLAGGIAHDFNNILGVIIGFTELSMMDIQLQPSLKYNLSQILKAGNRAKELVKQILNFSRQSEAEFKPLEMPPIVKETLKLMRSSLPSTIEIVQNIENRPLTIKGDPTQIHQILMNLCTNAAYAMRRTGGRLEIGLSAIELNQNSATPVSGLADSRYCCLSVKDTGCGMDQTTMERIFEPFFTTKGPGQGTGMGLSVVYGIIKSHGGAVRVASEEGRGTTFTVYLPLIENHSTKLTSVESLSLPTGTERILFVDDEAALADLAEVSLSRLGYRVKSLTSSLDSLAVFKDRPQDFDLVITDLTMPKMTGLELAKEITAIKPGLPVILCTGLSHMITPELAAEIGIKRLLVKPLDLNEVASTIRDILDTRA